MGCKLLLLFISLALCKNVGEACPFHQNNTGPRYTQKILDDNRKVTFDCLIGKSTFETNADVIKGLEEVRNNKAAQMTDSPRTPGANSSQNLSSCEEESRAARSTGDDNRYKVPTSRQYPYCAMGQLITLQTMGRGLCTLVLVGPYHALTAAHCVYDRKAKKFANRKIAFIGRDCCRAGSAARISTITIYDRFRRDNILDPAFDIAFLVLAKDDINSLDCHMAVAFQDPMPRVSATACGYPRDRDADVNDNRHCLYCSDCNDTTLSTYHNRNAHVEERIRNSCYATAGMSGGPVYTTDHDSTANLYIYGIISKCGGRHVLSSRISKRKFLDIRRWKKANGA